MKIAMIAAPLGFMAIAGSVHAQCVISVTRDDVFKWYVVDPSKISGIDAAEVAFFAGSESAVEACCCEPNELLAPGTGAGANSGFGGASASAEGYSGSAGAVAQSAPIFSSPNSISLSTFFSSGRGCSGDPGCCQKDLSAGSRIAPPLACCFPLIVTNGSASIAAAYDVSADVQWAASVETTLVISTDFCKGTQRTGTEPLTRLYLVRVGDEVQAGSDTVDPEAMRLLSQASEADGVGSVTVARAVTVLTFSGTALAGSDVPITLGGYEIRESQRGDADDDGALEFCDLIHLRARRQSGDPKFGDGDYLALLDADFDGTLDDDDESYLVSLLPLIDGDVNGDFYVDVFDFGIIAANFGAGPGATRSQGDLTGDGYVTVEDFGIYTSHFGDGAPESHPECFE